MRSPITHERAWGLESQGQWNGEHFGCPGGPKDCPPGTTAYSYVPTSETSTYITIIQNWAFANNVLQANEGPSFVAHQYYIAAQSGGLPGALTSPDAEGENPGDPPTAEPTGNYAETDDDIDLHTSGCHPMGYQDNSINMSSPVPTSPPLDNGPEINPCEEYTTILDEVGANQGTPPIDDWQYIAHADNSIWAAPLGVMHLWNEYSGDSNKAVEPFAVDPDAENFVLNISSSPSPSPSPVRPFASLTYITPCGHESDHPETSGTDDGPAWLAFVLNAIGESKYWNTTTIIVTWDDWGGFYENVPAVPVPGPFRPLINGYNNSDDPNEWGFRVPLMVISPYVKQRGYISSQVNSGFQYRSQSVIMQYIEATFSLASLGGDDMQDGHNDGLADVFNFSQSPLPYVPLSTTFTPGPIGTCGPGNGPQYRRTKFHPQRSGPTIPSLQTSPAQ